MTTVIYHARCPDGITAAWCFRRLADVVYVPASYGWEPPVVDDRDVYIVDFSYPREVLEQMKLKAKSLVVLDHHKTSEAALKGLDYCTFDVERSGAQIAWDYLNPGQSRPLVIDYVADRDLWQWKLPDSKNINTYLSAHAFDPRLSLEKSFEVLDNLVDHWDSESVGKIGANLAGPTSSYVEQLATNTFSGTVDYMVGDEKKTQEFVFCVCSILQSDTGNHIAEKYQKPALLIWLKNVDDGREIWGCSLRNFRGSPIDLSTIATSYGGGGHRDACGFSFTGSMFNLVHDVKKNEK